MMIIGRNLRIALLISFGVHILAVSGVEIIAPEDFRKRPKYTRIDFLGSILKKTAFDIMLGNVDPLVNGTYGSVFSLPQEGYLKVVVPSEGAGCAMEIPLSSK